MNSVMELPMYAFLQCWVLASPRQCCIMLYCQPALQKLAFPFKEFSSGKGESSSSMVMIPAEIYLPVSTRYFPSIQ